MTTAGGLPKHLAALVHARSLPKASTDQSLVVNNLLKIIEKEYQRGNQTIAKEKLDFLLEYQQKQQKQREIAKKTTPVLPVPLYPSLFQKISIEDSKCSQHREPLKRPAFRPHQPLTFKKVESILIGALENIANILDNLHLFLKMPMFPQKLLNLLKQTNKIWILILVFLIRKTSSQLLNLLKREKKVKVELAILRSNTNSKLLADEDESADAQSSTSVFRKYEKILKDLKFDKLMLVLELVGNFLDLSFNLIEFYEVIVPGWVMNALNFASMAMTVYRMNKDDEYVDDDISDELI